MRAVVQRADSGSVVVDGAVVGQIGRGLVAFVGAEQGDEPADLDYVLRKIVNLRVFEDAAGKLQHSVADIDGELLVVSQFTLFGDTSRGNRPSFSRAMAPEPAKAMLFDFVTRARGVLKKVETGVFGAHMIVTVVGNGPITLQIDSRQKSSG